MPTPAYVLHQQRLEQLSRLQSEVNAPKTQLLHIYNRLRDEGLDGAATHLDRVIAQLEAWQKRRRP